MFLQIITAIIAGTVVSEDHGGTFYALLHIAIGYPEMYTWERMFVKRDSMFIGQGSGTVTISMEDVLLCDRENADNSFSLYYSLYGPIHEHHKGIRIVRYKSSNSPGITQAPAGPSTAYINESVEFRIERFICRSFYYSDDFEFQFAWGDGKISEWGDSTCYHAYGYPGNFEVKARARYNWDESSISAWSEPAMISIKNANSEYIVKKLPDGLQELLIDGVLNGGWLDGD